MARGRRLRKQRGASWRNLGILGSQNKRYNDRVRNRFFDILRRQYRGRNVVLKAGKKLALKAGKALLKKGAEWVAGKILKKVRGKGAVFRGRRRGRRGGNTLRNMGEYTLGELEKAYRGNVNRNTIDQAIKHGYNFLKGKLNRGQAVYVGKRRQRAEGWRGGIVTPQYVRDMPPLLRRLHLSTIAY